MDLLLELLAQLFAKDATWLLAAMGLTAMVVVGIVVWKFKGGNGTAKAITESLELEKRVDVLEGKLHEATAILHSLEHGVAEASKTVSRFEGELGFLRGRLHELAKKMNGGSSDGSKTKKP